MTKAPIQANISLYTGQRPGSKASVLFGTTSTSSDGSFDIKSNAGWNSNVYYLEVLPTINTGNTSRELEYPINKNQNINVGDVLTGSYTFYCKVTIVPMTASAIDFPGLGSSYSTLHFNSGTSTQFVTHSSMDYDVYENVFQHTYRISYTIYPSGIAKDTAIYVPINSPDTLSVSINY